MSAELWKFHSNSCPLLGQLSLSFQIAKMLCRIDYIVSLHCFWQIMNSSRDNRNRMVADSSHSCSQPFTESRYRLKVFVVKHHLRNNSFVFLASICSNLHIRLLVRDLSSQYTWGPEYITSQVSCSTFGTQITLPLVSPCTVASAPLSTAFPS